MRDLVLNNPAGGVYHWCGLEKLSKWRMCEMISEDLGLDMTHLTEVTEKAVVRVEAHKRLGDMMVMVMEMGEGTLMDVINK